MGCTLKDLYESHFLIHTWQIPTLHSIQERVVVFPLF